MDVEAHILFSYLLDRNPDFVCREPTLTTVLCRLEKSIEGRLAAEPAVRGLLESSESSQLRRVTRRQSASPVKEVTMVQMGNGDERLLRVRGMQRVERLDKFLVRLCERIQVWEGVRTVKESCLDDWVYDMRRCDC